MIRNGFKHLYGLLASNRLAIVLLILLAVLLLIYLLVPQVDTAYSDITQSGTLTSAIRTALLHFFNMYDVQRSWLLFITYILLFINLGLCQVRRFRFISQKLSFPSHPPSINAGWPYLKTIDCGLKSKSVEEMIQSKGFRLLVENDIIYGLRGRFSIAGHWIFHIGLAILIGYGLWIVTIPAPFRGIVGVGEGESFDLKTSEFLSTTRPASALAHDLAFKLEKIDALLEGEDVRKFEALLSTPRGKPSSIKINNPFRKTPYQAMIHGFGYMPGWVIVNQRGKMIYGSWLKLVQFPLFSEDSFLIGPDESKVIVSFYPNYKPDRPESEKPDQTLANPRFMTKITWKGRKVFEGLLKPREKVTLDGAHSFLFMKEVRKYAILNVIEERPYRIIFAVFGILILGVVVRYSRTRKEILINIKDESIEIYGRSEMLENLFAEELDNLVSELASTVESSPLRESV